MKLFDRTKIVKWDQVTLDREYITGSQLMERAARGMARYLSENFLYQKFHIFCGNGKNGGDALAIARLLHEQNIEVKVYILEIGKSCLEFLENMAFLNMKGIPYKRIEIPSDWIPDREGIILDGILGTGVHYPLPPLVQIMIPILNKSGLPIISIDIPSGLPPDIETQFKPEPLIGIRASQTLYIEVPKLSSLVPGTGEYYGKQTRIPIGLDQDFYQTEPSPWYLTGLEEALKLFKTRGKFAYKNDFGHSLIIAGSYGKAGAALLSTQACIASGSGLVTVLSPERNSDILQLGAPEAMFLSGGGDTILNSIPKIPFEKFQAIGIGPGLGTDSETNHCLFRFIKNIRRPLVLDADALNILSSHSNERDFIPEGSILTPHVGEFNRLTQGGSEDSFQRIILAKSLAISLKSIIILKGAYTAVIFPNQEVHFNSTGNPGMATGGSGDVLTGILTGLLAQGYSSRDAALLGVYIHGRAGDMAAQAKGENALKAGDITFFLSQAFLELEKLKNPFWPEEPIPDLQIPPV